MRSDQRTSTTPTSLARSHILERNLAMLGDREESQRARRTFSQRICDTIRCAAGGAVVCHGPWSLVWRVDAL